MWPGFDSQTRHHIWVEFVGFFHSAPKGFSPGTLGLPSPKFDLIYVNLLTSVYSVPG